MQFQDEEHILKYGFAPFPLSRELDMDVSQTHHRDPAVITEYDMGGVQQSTEGVEPVSMRAHGP